MKLSDLDPSDILTGPPERSDDSGVLIENGEQTRPDIFGRYPAIRKPTPEIGARNGRPPIISGGQAAPLSLSDLKPDDVTETPPEDGGSFFKRNQAYARAEANGYATKLSPKEEGEFQQWVKANGVPFDPSATADYDMRGYWKALNSGDPNARQEENSNDGKMHFPDTFKTPFHRSFSNESIYATADAPHWLNDHQLVDKSGKVVFDERPEGLSLSNLSAHEVSEKPPTSGPGVFSALAKGGMAGAREVGESFKQTAQLAGGGTPEATPDVPADEQALAAPLSLKPGMPNFPKIAYHFAQGAVGGSPEMGTALLTGLATTAATGNPLAALFTGSAAAAGVNVLRQVAPNFAAQLKAHPDDPDLAWKRALETTTIGGVSTAVGFAAFGINPFEGELKNLAFQAFGIQPGVAMATRAAENKVEGKPVTPEEQGQTYAEAVLGTLGPYAAMRPFHGRAKPAGGEPPPPGTEEPPAPPGDQGPPGGDDKRKKGPAEEFAAEPPDFIKTAEPPPDDKGGPPPPPPGAPRTFKIDPAAYGVDTTGMEPAKAAQAVNLATATEASAEALRKALSDPAIVDRDTARDFEIPSFVRDRNESTPNVSERASLGGDQGRVEPTLAGPGKATGDERGGSGEAGARLPPADGEIVHERPAATAAAPGTEAVAGRGRDTGTTGEPESGGANRESIEPGPQAGADSENTLNVRRAISRATGQKGVRVYTAGEGAAYDPLGGYFTVGADYPAHKEAIAAAADLAKKPAPEGWRDTPVDATLDDNTQTTTTAGNAADAITTRIKRAMSVMECLGA